MDIVVKKLVYSTVFPLVFILALWLVYFVDQGLNLELFFHGLYPRKISGLQGIAFAPLIHSGIRHLFANTIPLIALGSLLFYFYNTMAIRVLLFSYLVPGIAVWIFGRSSYHIGASGIIYSLAGFLFLSGLIRKHLGLMAVSLLVVMQYGAMIWGVFPLEKGVSWESHLSGLLIGLFLAWYFRKKGPRGFKSYAQGMGYTLSGDGDSDGDDTLPWDEYEVEGPLKNEQTQK